MKFKVEKRSKYQKFIETFKALEGNQMVTVTKEENDQKNLQMALRSVLVQNGCKGVRTESINGHINFFKDDSVGN